MCEQVEPPGNTYINLSLCDHKYTGRDHHGLMLMGLHGLFEHTSRQVIASVTGRDDLVTSPVDLFKVCV